MTDILPYGSWPSPISADLLADKVVAYQSVAFDGDALWWLESRPAEGGRSVLVRDGDDVTPEGFNVRTLVHEYGGGAFIVRDGTVWFSNFEDQRLYRQAPGDEPVAVTPEPRIPRGDRYADADLTPDGRFLYCIRERHGDEGNEPVNTIVRVPADGDDEPVVLADGTDFCSSPRVSPDGTLLAWLTWDHPNLPWDGTHLRVAHITPDGSLTDERVVLGGPDESVFQPAWSPDGVLHAVSDRTGWWNLYRLDGGEPAPLHPAEAEFGVPGWALASSTYAFLDDGRIVCRVEESAVARLHLLSPDGGLEDAGLRWRSFRPAVISSNGRRVAFPAASPTDPLSVVAWEPGGQDVVVRRSSSADLDPEYVSVAEPISFPTAGGQTAHALFFPPRNPSVTAPEGDLPPLLVNVHGGPTSSTDPGFKLAVQFWTTRGFAFCDLNYRGSTGYGREYRNALRGQWGVADVEDAAAAVRHLVEASRVDGRRTAVRGGSAGGYTTLCSLAFDDTFTAGVSHYGVTDLTPFVEDTHKFEARYLDRLVGPWPDAADVYAERSPARHARQIDRPVLLLQGLEDAIVPPSQAERMLSSLREVGTPHAYLAFEGEQHGWRRAATIVRAHEAELAFYAEVFGLEPADDLEPVTLVV